jgi:growth factor-regulated tyrosine kinase substrate
MSFQSQAPPSQSGGKTEAEIKEEEDLQLALALSQSEAEEKEKLKLKNTSTILAGAAAKTNNTAVSSAVEEKVRVRNVFVLLELQIILAFVR